MAARTVDPQAVMWVDGRAGKSAAAMVERRAAWMDCPWVVPRAG
jgi:hypothetical protein